MKQANIDYKQTPYFKPNKPLQKKDFPSLNVDSEINTTIKENPYKANVEIEGKEVVLKPDLSALFKAKGKRHSQGGMDVFLDPNSFVFSDDKELSFTDEDADLFELKKGGKVSNPYKNTPARILEKNIDLEHYNRLVNNLDDKNKDTLAKESSMLMLEKYMNTLGNIAYIQEQKKDFPQGIPDFAMGTAPVYKAEVKDDIMEQKQYAKYGGIIGNPYKMQVGGIKLPRFDKPSEFDLNLSIPKVNKPYGGQKYDFINDPFNNGLIEPTSSIERDRNEFGANSTYGILSNAQEGNKDNGVEINWAFDPYQKLSQLYNLYQATSVKKYMPMRSRFMPTYLDPTLINSEQAKFDARAGANQQLRALSGMSPILRNAQAQGIYGQYLDRVPQLDNQAEMQNAQLKNNTNQYNNQLTNSSNEANINFDQRYLQDVTKANVNADNMTNYLTNNFVSGYLDDVKTNKGLAYQLATQGPKPAYGYDFKTGNFYRNEKNILDAYTGTSENSWDATVKRVTELRTMGLSDDVISALIKSRAFSQMAPYLGMTPTFGQMMKNKKGGYVNPYK